MQKETSFNIAILKWLFGPDLTLSRRIDQLSTKLSLLH